MEEKWNMKWIMFQNLVIKEHESKKKRDKKEKPRLNALIRKSSNGVIKSSRLYKN